MDGAGIRQAVTKAISRLWREGVSNSRPQEHWLEAQSRVQLGRAGYQGFPLNSGEKRLPIRKGLSEDKCMPAEASAQTDQVSTVTGQETSLAQCWARKGQSGGVSAGLWLWFMLLANELPAGAPVLF